MRLRTLRLLPGLWCGLVIAPAVVATAALKGGHSASDADGDTVAINVVVNNVYIKRTLRLRIERSDGVPPYEAKYRGTFMLGEIPSPGSVLVLRVDPHRPQHFEASEKA